jgi:TRAP-type C4-dicarboxylate transport system permease small subunit
MKMELTKLMQALRKIFGVFIWPFGIGIASCLVAYFGTIIWAKKFGPLSLAEQGPVFLGMAAGLIGFIIGLLITIIRERKSRDHD